MTHDRIESRPDVMFGKPVIKGMRIPVQQTPEHFGPGHDPRGDLRLAPAADA